MFACRKSKVSQEYYESGHDETPIRQSFRRPIEFLYVPEMEEDALKVVRVWEGNIHPKQIFYTECFEAVNLPM